MIEKQRPIDQTPQKERIPSRDPVKDLESFLLEKKVTLDSIERKLLDISNQRLGNEMYGDIKYGVPGAYKPTEAHARESKIAALTEVGNELRAYKKELEDMSWKIRSLPAEQGSKFQPLLEIIPTAINAAIEWLNATDVVQAPQMLESGENVNVDALVDRAIQTAIRPASEVSSAIQQLDVVPDTPKGRE